MPPDLRRRRSRMKVARIVNAAFWLYLWFSAALLPVTTAGDFWTAKAKQLVSLNPSLFDDPARFIGNGMILIILMLLIDWPLRRAARAARAKLQSRFRIC